MCAAVHVSDVKFFYSKNQVLRDINLLVPYGKIYSLLGPSSAGKTTLLRLILGRIKVTYGQIQVLDGKPGQHNRVIGYMPQDFALCPSFTVGQTLKYFASLFSLSHQEYVERKTKIGNLFGLPNDNEKISEISGGQQKLVSLCIPFIQNCRLMILDEPTVGSDPKLGDTIWKYLHSMCQEKNMTVILVTHYIQETLRSHLTGFMRDGRILEEGPPQMLLRKYQQNTLEDVFLYLSLTKDASNPENETELGQQGNEFQLPSININKDQFEGIESCEVIDMIPNDNPWQIDDGIFANIMLKLWILLVLIRKNLSGYCKSNTFVLGYLLPPIQVFILCSIITNDNIAVPVAVYNTELEPDYSIQILNSSKKFDAYYLKTIQFDSLESAIDALNNRKVCGIIEFPPNFTEAIGDRFINADHYFDDYYNGTSNDNSNIKIYQDNSEYLFANAFMNLLYQSLFEFFKKLFSIEKNYTLVDPILKIEEIVYSQGTKMTDFLFPGFAIWFLYFFLTLLSSIPLIQEKKDGLFERLLLVGVSHQLILLSHFFACIILSIIQINLLLFVAYVWFQMKLFSSIWEVYLLLQMQAISSIAIGLLVSSIFKDLIYAAITVTGFTFPQVIASTALVPKEFMPIGFREISRYFPIGIPSDSLRNSMLRGWNLLHPKVFDGLLLNLILTLVSILISIVLFKKNS